MIAYACTSGFIHVCLPYIYQIYGCVLISTCQTHIYVSDFTYKRV